VKRTFGMTAEVNGVLTQLTVSVEDVWYALRHPDTKELVSLGVWLPPISDGLLVEIVKDEDVPAMFAELQARMGVPS